MIKDDKVRDVAEAVKGIVEAVPVYQDVVQPAAREVGKGLQTVAQTILIALAPLEALVWGYGTMRDYLGEALTKRLKDVPPEHIVTPQATVAGPALDALRYAGPDPELRELYANLLARTMDERTAMTAHPAFVEILRQLTPDEARILRHLAPRDGFPVVSITSVHPDTSYDWALRHFSMLGEQAGCAFPGLIRTYLDNLRRLGLVDLFEDRQDATPGAYHALLLHPVVTEAIEQAKVGGQAELHEEVLIVTSLGRQFCDAVVIPKPA
jgi:hypothetical protein